MTDTWTALVSEYLDGELPPARKLDVEHHLEECPECRAVLDDLRLLTSRSRELPPILPERDLWPGIESRIGVSGARGGAHPEPSIQRWLGRRISFSFGQLAGACAALLVLAVGLTWYGLVQMHAREDARIAAALRSSVNTQAAIASSDHAAFHDIAELRRILASGRGKLAPSTVRSLEESLVIIDVAIRQAQRALEADPGNPYVRAHLNETMHRKIELMRRATQLASAP